MLLAIVLGVVLGLGAAYLRRAALSPAVAIAIFVVAALVFVSIVDDDDVWVVAGAMLAASGLVDLVTAGDDPRVPASVARMVGAVLLVGGVALVALA